MNPTALDIIRSVQINQPVRHGLQVEPEVAEWALRQVNNMLERWWRDAQGVHCQLGDQEPQLTPFTSLPFVLADVPTLWPTTQTAK